MSEEFVTEETTMADHVAAEFAERHPGTVHLLRMLLPNDNLPARLYAISVRFHEMALMLLSEVDDGPELTVGLRKLLEAKDCFVRAAL